MIFYGRKWLERFKFVLVFFIFTFVLYHMLVAVSQWIEPIGRYREPSGRAVKVFQNHVSLSDQGTIGDRLRLFYWLGE